MLNTEVMEEGSFRNAEASLAKQFGKLPRTRIALETGTESGWISRQLESCGHEVIVAHARDLEGISRSDRKNDRNDAEKLARYARLEPELLNPIEHCTAQQQTDLCAIRARDAFVRARALLVNTARGLAKTEGLRLPPSITPTLGARSLKGLPLPLQTMLRPLLEQIDLLGKQLETYDALVEQIAAERYAEETKLLRSVPGVGPVTSLTYVLTLSDAQRFRRSREVGPYWGLQPKQQPSGERDPQLGISKAGNRYLRKCWCNARITFWDTLDGFAAMAVGFSAGWARRKECQEAGYCRGGAYTRGAAASAVGEQATVSTVLQTTGTAGKGGQ